MCIKRRSVRIATMLITMIIVVTAIFAVTSHRSDAASNYPVLKTLSTTGIKGSEAVLGSGYTFIHDAEWPYNDSETYAYIETVDEYGDTAVKAAKELGGGERMYCIGKYGNKFYFNVESFKPNGVYTYKIGDDRFRKLPNSSGLNLQFFRKKDVAKAEQKTNGLLNKRYIAARHVTSTDASSGFCDKVSIFDVKTNKKRVIGRVQDFVVKGKQIYWVTTSSRFYKRNTKIVVKSCKLSGKQVRVRKRYKAAFLADSYGRGTITKKYVKWNYATNNGEKYISHNWKRRY